MWNEKEKVGAREKKRASIEGFLHIFPGGREKLRQLINRNRINDKEKGEGGPSCRKEKKEKRPTIQKS